MREKRNKKPGVGILIASLVILVLGMVVGFALLGMVYEGPRWVKALFALIIIALLTFLIRAFFKMIKAMKEESGKEKPNV